MTNSQEPQKVNSPWIYYDKSFIPYLFNKNLECQFYDEEVQNK